MSKIEREELHCYECPRCGTREVVNRWGWETRPRPCDTSDDCIKNLRKRVEEIERTLERHGF